MLFLMLKKVNIRYLKYINVTANLDGKWDICEQVLTSFVMKYFEISSKNLNAGAHFQTLVTLFLP
jgi:hypothetical protein